MGELSFPSTPLYRSSLENAVGLRGASAQETQKALSVEIGNFVPWFLFLFICFFVFCGVFW